MTLASELAQTIENLQCEGRRLFSTWNPHYFQQIGEGPAARLFEHIKDDPTTDVVIAGYLKLIFEGVGTGSLRPSRDYLASGETLLARCFLTLIPEQLSLCPPELRVKTLCSIWNICENAASRLPTWAYAYISFQATRELTDLTEVRNFLQRQVSNIFDNRPTRSSNQFRTSVVDMKPLDPEFMPGTISLMAPNAVAIEDQFRPCYISLIVDQAGKPVTFGPLHDSFEVYTESETRPVSVHPGQIVIDGHEVQLPNYPELASYAASSAGFVVGSAADSQRLWFVSFADI